MRKRAERILSEIAAAHNAKLKETGDSPMGVTVEAVDILTAGLTAAVKEKREAAVRKAYKAGWESAMYNAHVEYGADDKDPAPELTDGDVAALLMEEK